MLLSERRSCFVFLFWKPLQLVILPNLENCFQNVISYLRAYYPFSFKGILQNNTLLPDGKSSRESRCGVKSGCKLPLPLPLPQLLQEHTSGDKSLCGRVNPPSDSEGNKERALPRFRERCSHKH